MDERDLDRLIGVLEKAPVPRVDIEQRVWASIARMSDRQSSILSLGAPIGWQFSAGALALASFAGFMAATIAPIAQARPAQAFEAWTTHTTALAPSTILGD